MKNIRQWFKTSSRDKHAIVAGFVATVFTIIGAMIAAFSWELSQKRCGAKFEWGDIAASAIGAVVGQAVQISIVYGLSVLHGLSLWLGVCAAIIGVLCAMIVTYCAYYWNKKQIPRLAIWSAFGLFGAFITLVGLTINTAFAA